MKLNEYLSNRLKEVLTEGKWITGTNFKNEIVGLSWQEATLKVDNFNTIAALTFHINYYLNGIIKVFNGGTLDIKDKFSFDAPPIESSQDWENLIDKFKYNSTKFIQLVDNMGESRLSSSFAGEKYGSYHRNIDVMIEHTYYHLGQIILIKKKIKNNK